MNKNREMHTQASHLLCPSIFLSYKNRSGCHKIYPFGTGMPLLQVKRVFMNPTLQKKHANPRRLHPCFVFTAS